MSRAIDITGKRYGRLTVVSRAPNRDSRRSQWLCVCDCGGTKTTLGHTLRIGRAKSCGCLHDEGNPAPLLKFHTHGESRTSAEYRCWEAIKTRCYNPRFKFYKYYGAVGVTMCDCWLNSYENFLADMGRKPSPSHSIDRFPDPYGNYEPGNCRWATPKEQANNRRARAA